MNHFPILRVISFPIIPALACNIGSTPPDLTPTLTPTLDAAVQADQAVATASAVITATGSASAIPATPTEVPPTSTFPPPPPTDTPVPPTASLPSWPLIRQGDEGPVVFALQHLLTFHGHNLILDGKFGPQTRSRVTSFQTDNGLGVDGIVGPQTWSALIQGAQVQYGSSGAAVRAAHSLLHDKFGYSFAVDGFGSFGPVTEDAVKAFQTSYGLIVDGIVGPQTWQALVSIEP